MTFKSIFGATCTCFLLSGFNSNVQAALIEAGSGLIYDSDQDITWLRDGMYSKTSGYDSDGLMTWNEATPWAANLEIYDAANGITYIDWRLPTITELQYMYQSNNIRRNSPGPFVNLQPTLNKYYLSSTGTNNPTLVRAFSMNYGTTVSLGKIGGALHYSWAVIDGDVAGALVPIPAAIWLFGSGLIGLIGIARRKGGMGDRPRFPVIS